LEKQEGTFKSDLSGLEFPISEKVSGKTLRQSLIELIKKDNPKFSPDNFLSVNELDFFRKKYITEYLTEQIGVLTEQENTVLNSIQEEKTLSDKIDGEDNQTLTIGQKVADKVASFGGSWTFIISFGIFIFFWISLNVFWLINNSFDPYPFILLNLILSCLAALQAPVIMMSQNRQEEKDRERAKKDYMINLKSELEIRTLHEKIDHLIMFQQQEILEKQKIQIGKLNKILDRLESNK
jgi:uncharacterized membrane protein